MLGENLTKLVENTHKSEFYGTKAVQNMDYDYYNFFMNKGGKR